MPAPLPLITVTEKLGSGDTEGSHTNGSPKSNEKQYLIEGTADEALALAAAYDQTDSSWEGLVRGDIELQPTKRADLFIATVPYLRSDEQDEKQETV